MFKRLLIVLLLTSALWTTTDEKRFPVCFIGCGISKQVLHCNRLMKKNLKRLSLCVQRHHGILVVDIRNHPLTCTCAFLEFAKKVKLTAQKLLFHNIVCNSKHIETCGVVSDLDGDSDSIYHIFGGHILNLNSPDFDDELASWDLHRRAVLSKLRGGITRDKYLGIQTQLVENANGAADSLLDDLTMSPIETYDDDGIIRRLDYFDYDEPGPLNAMATELLIFIIFHILGMTIIIILLLRKCSVNGDKKSNHPPVKKEQSTGKSLSKIDENKELSKRDIASEHKWQNYLKDPNVEKDASEDLKNDPNTQKNLKKLADEMKHRKDDRPSKSKSKSSADDSQSYSGYSGEYTTGYSQEYSKGYSGEYYSWDYSTDYSKGDTTDYSKGDSQDYSSGQSHDYSRGDSQDYSSGYSQEYSIIYDDYSEDSPEFSPETEPTKRNIRGKKLVRHPQRAAVHSLQYQQDPNPELFDSKSGKQCTKKDSTSQVTKSDIFLTEANSEGEGVRVDRYAPEQADIAGQQIDNLDMPLEGTSLAQQQHDKKLVTFDQKFEARVDESREVDRQESAGNKRKRSHQVERTALAERPTLQDVKDSQRFNVFSLDNQRPHCSKDKFYEMESHEKRTEEKQDRLEYRDSRQENRQRQHYQENRPEYQEKRSEYQEKKLERRDYIEKRQERQECLEKTPSHHKKRPEYQEKKLERRDYIEKKQERQECLEKTPSHHKKRPEYQEKIRERQEYLEKRTDFQYLEKIPEYQEKVPEYQEKVPEYQEMIPDYQKKRLGYSEYEENGLESESEQGLSLLEEDVRENEEEEQQYRRGDKKYLQVPVVRLRNNVPYTEYLNVEIAADHEANERNPSSINSMQRQNEFSGINIAEFNYAFSKEERRRNEQQQFDDEMSPLIVQKSSRNESDLQRRLSMKRELSEKQRLGIKDSTKSCVVFSNREMWQREHRIQAEEASGENYAMAWILDTPETKPEAVLSKHADKQKNESKRRAKNPHTVRKRKYKDELYK